MLYVLTTQEKLMCLLNQQDGFLFDKSDEFGIEMFHLMH